MAVQERLEQVRIRVASTYSAVETGWVRGRPRFSLELTLKRTAYLCAEILRSPAARDVNPELRKAT